MKNLSDQDSRNGDMRTPIELKVEYKKLNTFFADYTKNICKGGTFIRTAKPLDVGTEFIFKLTIPRLREPLSIRGQVRWVKREGMPVPDGAIGHGGPDVHGGPDGQDPFQEPGMGIRFIYDTPEQRAVIEGTVERMMIDSLGQLIYSKLMNKERGSA